MSKKALVITEGSTDWKHLKAAFNNLKSNTQYSSLFDNLDFDFLEYQPSDFNMGADTLASMCENFSRIKQERLDSGILKYPLFNNNGLLKALDIKIDNKLQNNINIIKHANLSDIELGVITKNEYFLQMFRKFNRE